MVAKNAGVRNLWKSVASSAAVESYFGEPNPDTRETLLVAAWNELFDERDIIVHRISQATGWRDERIVQIIELTRVIIAEVLLCLISDISDLLQRMPAEHRVPPEPEIPANDEAVVEPDAL